MTTTNSIDILFQKLGITKTYDVGYKMYELLSRRMKWKSQADRFNQPIKVQFT